MDPIVRFVKTNSRIRHAAMAIFQVDPYTESLNMEQYAAIMRVTMQFSGIKP